MTGVRVTEKREDLLTRIYLMKKGDDIFIIQNSRIIGKLVWEKKKEE
jgi:hypothetical protein